MPIWSAFALFCALTQVFAKYKQYVKLLKWLTLALFAYIATLFMVRRAVGRGASARWSCRKSRWTPTM